MLPLPVPPLPLVARSGRLRQLLLAVLSAGILPAAGSAQIETIPPLADEDAIVVVDTLDTGVSPGGAFLRSIVIPGWGHAAIGSHRRGAFYLAAQGGTGWMLFRIAGRLRSARDRAALVEEVTRAHLLAEGVPPEELEDRLDDDPRVSDARGLVAARTQQREDWLALGIFLTLLGGADAFVSAHLQDFPVQPEISANPDGRVSVGLRVPVGN